MAKCVGAHPELRSSSLSIVCVLFDRRKKDRTESGGKEKKEASRKEKMIRTAF